MVTMKETIDDFAPLHENREYKEVNSKMKRPHEELIYSILKPEDRKNFHRYGDLVSELMYIVEEIYFKIGYETLEFHGKLSE